jgi:serpin B
MGAMKRRTTWLAAGLALWCAGAAQGRDGFALGLYGELSAAEGGNLVCSPHGVAEVLGMLEAAAAGRTKEELRGTAVPEGVEDVAGYFAGKRGDWVALAEAGGGEAQIADSVWLGTGSRASEGFLRVLGEAYGAEAFEADFADGPTAAGRINGWVVERTKGRIARLFDGGEFDGETRAVLCNAVWFAGKWETPFERQLTAEGEFRTADGRRQKVPMMHRRGRMRLAEREEGRMLALPYAGGEIEFRAWLPAEGMELASLEAALAADWDSWEEALVREEVALTLPKFRLEWGPSELSAALRALGVVCAFENEAEFPGLGEDVKVSKVLQAASIEVDEEGTVAAAATGAALKLKGMPRPPKAFTADRPFAFAVVERATGCVLFMGRLAEVPGAGETISEPTNGKAQE